VWNRQRTWTASAKQKGDESRRRFNYEWKQKALD
jgi:hypothetical protein